MLLAVLAAGAVYLGIAGGASKATLDASAEALALSRAGAFGEAMDLDDAVARRTGPLFVFARSAVSGAPLAGQRVLLAWADSLDRQGRVDQAVAVVGGVTDPRLLGEAASQRARILFDAARSEAGRGHFAAAIARLGQLQAARPPAAAAAAAARLMPRYLVGEATQLTKAGDGADSVALLDRAAALGAGRLTSAVYPQALLTAGRQQLSLGSFREALATLQRLVQHFTSTTQAAQARAMLGAPQAVTGTLVDRAGHAVRGRVRLSRHFHGVAGGYYTTGPFYYTTTDSTGTFRFDAVPVGGPYVLEIYRGGDWTTFVNPSTGQPAEPVTVAALTPVDLTFIELP